MSEQKYREFFVYQDGQLGSVHFSSTKQENKPWLTLVNHVIEHSAYQAAQDKIQQLEYLLNKINENVVPGVMDSSESGIFLITKLEKQNEIYRKALEFYGNAGYGFRVICEEEVGDGPMSGWIQCDDGEIARQALKDAEEVK